jgi:predicted DCC family thiol-disulfide oxidoreductase YuxK
MAAQQDTSPSASGPPGPVLLYDGECGLCNRFVRLLLRLDARAVLHFAALQGPEAQSFLRDHGLPTADFDSLVLVPDWAHRERPEFLLRTDALVAAFRAIGGALAELLAMIRIVPTPLRDGAYRVVARVRYRIFGPWKSCPLPRPEWGSRFIR